MSNQLFIITSLLVLIYSCNKELSIEECNDLSMKSFKGIPAAANSFEKNCKNIEITYTKELCKKALKDLILGANELTLKATYGEKIVNCFTTNDLLNFKKK